MSNEGESAEQSGFKDRSMGLSIYGFFQIVMGGFSALMVPMLFLSIAVNPQGGMSAAQMIPAAGMYAGLAVAFVWLGIGSIQSRRWARALTLVLAWMWLAMGSMTLIMMAFWMPSMTETLAAQDQQLPPGTAPIMHGIMLSTMGCMYLVLPGIFILFYARADVKATCDAKDPVVRWTDRCPLPVLSLSLFLGFCATSVIWSASYGFVAPFFGFVIKGVPGAVFFLGICSMFGYLAWATYKLKTGAWWATVGVMVLFGLSTVISFSRIGLMDLYREMNFPDEQLKMIEKMGVSEMNISMITSVNFVVFIVYLLWVRSYFPARAIARET